MEFIGIDLVSKVTKQISGNVNNMATTVEKAGARTTSAWGKVGSVLKIGVLALATVVATAGLSVGTFIEKAVAGGDAAHELAEKFGFAGHEASAWLSVLRQTGVDQEAFTTGLRVMSTHVAANDKAFGALGVNLRDSKGQMRSVNDILMDTITTLSKMPAGAERSALVSHLFGRGGQQLTTMLDEGPAKIQQMMKGGTTMTDQQVESAHKLVMEWRQVKEMGMQLATTVGNALMPVFANVLGWLLSDGIPAFHNLANTIGSVVGPIFKNVAAFIGTVLVPAFKEIWANMQPGIKVLMPVWNKLMADAQPILKTLSGFLTEHHGAIKTVITVIGTLIGYGVLGTLIVLFTAADKIIHTVTTTVSAMVDAVKIAVGWVKSLADAVGRIKMPDIKIPSGFQLPHFQSGGFVPSDMVAGLHGGEFVLPKSAVDAVRGGAQLGPHMPQRLATSPKSYQTAAGGKIEELLQKILEALINGALNSGGTTGKGALSPSDVLAAFNHLVEAAQIQRGRGTRAGYVQ